MRILIPLIAYVIAAVALFVWPPAVLLTWLVTFPFDRNRVLAGRLLRLCAALMSRIVLFWHVRIDGRWPTGGGAYVVVAKHQSFLDIFLLCNLPHEMKWVAKRELFRIPWVGWAFYLTGDIPLDRGDAASAAAVLAKARRYLANGMSVMIFPEGTRSKDGQLLPFKAGAFKLAMDAGVPILPIAITGTAEGMPKGSPWVRPARLHLRVLEPIATAGRDSAERGSREEVRAVAGLRDEVRARIAAAVAADSGVPTASSGAHSA